MLYCEALAHFCLCYFKPFSLINELSALLRVFTMSASLVFLGGGGGAGVVGGLECFEKPPVEVRDKAQGGKVLVISLKWGIQFA